MPSVAYVGGSGSTVATGSPLTVTLSYSPVAGNMIRVDINQNSASARTYVLSDNIGGTTGWVRRVRYNGSGGPEIWTKVNVPAGITSITATHGSGSGAFIAGVSEYSGMGATPTVIDTEIFQDAATTAAHFCSTTGITDAGYSLGMMCGGVYGGSTWTDAVVSGSWNELFGNTEALSAYQVFPTGMTTERGPYTSTGTQRQARGVLAVIAPTPDPPPTVVSLTPILGSESGGTAVTITGTGFSGASVTFGGNPATSVVTVNATTITCVTPAGTVGATGIVVTNADTQFATLVDGFEYTEDILVAILNEGGSTATITASSVTFTITGVPAGAAIIACVAQTSADTFRDYGVSSTSDGAFNQVIKHRPSRAAYGYIKKNVIGGDTEITISKIEGGTSSWGYYWWVVIGVDNVAQPVTGSRVGSSTTTHPVSLGLNVDSSSLVFTASAGNGTYGTRTPATDYTQGASVTSQTQFQAKLAESPISGDTATWTSSTARISTSIHMAFPVAGSYEPPPADTGLIMMSWG